jgi:hypothetical protein
MRPPLSSDKQKYYHLLSLVCEDLHTSAIDALVRTDHEASTSTLTAVRQGRKIDLVLLIDLVRIGLPDYTIPAELLPVVVLTSAMPQPLFA